VTTAFPSTKLYHRKCNANMEIR